MSADAKRSPEPHVKPVMAMARLVRAKAAATTTQEWRSDAVATSELKSTTVFASVNGHAQAEIDRRPAA